MTTSKLEGIHHITAITADAQSNVDFYAGVLGLRLVKKTVNQDNPTVYHLFYADEKGSAGSDLTFFEYPGLPVGRAGDGMIHRIVWRVAGSEALDFWAERLEANGVDSRREGEGEDEAEAVFADPEGLEHELLVTEVAGPAPDRRAPGDPAEVALRGFHAARAYARNPDAPASFSREGLDFEQRGTAAGRRAARAAAASALRRAPRGAGAAGRGHRPPHRLGLEDRRARGLAREGGGRRRPPTPVIDRFYFRSIYFREPSGVLFEIATLGPGFTVDEPLESLGEKLSLPPDYEHLREQVEPKLRPIVNPRTAART